MTKTVEVVVDPETGLPALPEGMFWRVKRIYLSPGRVVLWLYRMGQGTPNRLQRWLGLTPDAFEIEGRPILSNGTSSSFVQYLQPEDIYSTAVQMWTKWRLDEENAAEVKRTIEALVGDYPPKNLKEVR